MKIFGHPLVSRHLLGKTAVVSVDEGDSNSGGKAGDSGMSERDNVIMVGEEVSGGANEGDAMIMVGAPRVTPASKREREKGGSKFCFVTPKLSPMQFKENKTTVNPCRTTQLNAPCHAPMPYLLLLMIHPIKPLPSPMPPVTHATPPVTPIPAVISPQKNKRALNFPPPPCLMTSASAFSMPPILSLLHMQKYSQIINNCQRLILTFNWKEELISQLHS